MKSIKYFIVVALLCILVTIIWAADQTVQEKGLVAHWKLAGDCRDYSGNDNHGQGINVEFDPPAAGEGGAAIFNGRNAYIRVKDNNSLNLGMKDFTIALWVKTEQYTDDVLGDLMTKFDPVSRKGFNLSIMNYPGAANAQPNHRNLFFGIDDAKIDKGFADCGRPGEANYITTLTVYDGSLYASTYEGGEHGLGHVYRYDSGQKWIDCGSPDSSNTVMSMAVLDGKLYAGTGYYHSQGSALKPSGNEKPGGKVFRYEGGAKWTDCGRLGEHGMVYSWVVQGGGPAKDVWALTTFKNHLYGHPLVSEGVWRYDGEQKWTYVGSPGRRMFGLGVYNGTLYGMGNDIGGIVRYDGRLMWENAGYQKNVTQVYSIAVHNGIMYAGVWPNGSVFRHDGDTTWTEVGQLGKEEEVMGMLVYNGKMYAGTLPLAQIYRYEGDSNWTYIDRVDYTPDMRYRRAWSLAVFNGKLYVGALPSGHVFAIEAGKCVTDDHELAPGWKHLVVVRDNNRLKLYIDGQLKSTSTTFSPKDFNISNADDLKIGFGTHDYFLGKMRDVRIYNRVMDQAAVKQLMLHSSAQ